MRTTDSMSQKINYPGHVFQQDIVLTEVKAETITNEYSGTLMSRADGTAADSIFNIIA